MGHGSSRSASSVNILSTDELTLVENLFKSMSRSSGSIKREDIFKHWSTHLDDILLQFVVRFLCHEPGKKVSAINGENFGRLYVFAIRGSPDERTTLIFEGYSEEEKKTEIPTATFLQYVQAIINSYLRLQKNSNNSRYQSWSSIGCTVNTRRIGLRSRSLCENLVKNGDTLTTEQVESWFAHASTFNSILSHVFQCLFLISQKKGDKNTTGVRINDLNLLPMCKGLENIPHFPSILGLGDVLFLNLSLPHELRDEWRFLFSSQVHGESFSTMLGRIVMQGATLVIVQDTDDHVFGGFASDNWSVGSNMFGNQSCFLFMLEPHILTFPSTGYNNHFQYLNLHQQTMPNGMFMGGQLNYPGLWLDCEYGTGKSSVSCTTFQNYVQLSGKENFTVKHCEVWGVGPVPETEENVRDLGSILEQDPTSQVMLELAGRKMHSEGLRDKKN
ncbi:TLD domain-containing protein 1 [Orussus abietinus]|uniref:TLD domain-containing protein 1 n=1 Tax=Orussus abietinus TaxID=222816 RepID=UPI0006253CE2|nr:TLD domain-containing protein 1 [Orussus abietinus]XP_012284975.1 TLD domain-containing protein 1 [Orussus abietinus]XP_012284976.1 TLD domain-containing protein 1 [Orussus abietinus]